MRRTLAAVVMAATIVLLAAPPAEAAAVRGSTDVLGTPTGGEPLLVAATIDQPAPIAPYEYSLLNRCWFSGRVSGPGDSTERFDLAGPWFLVGGQRQTTAEVNLNDVPAGALCRVTIMKGTSAVKGSATTYSVG